jgi:hypothetical protein
MKHITQVTLTALLLWVPLSAQSLIIPHVADGGGWKTTIVLTNTSPNPATATLVFHQQTQADGSTQPWNPPIVEVVSTSGLSMAGGSTLFLNTAGTAADVSVGWAELNADSGVIGYVVFSIRAGATQDEGTAPAVAASNRILVPYDDSNGFVTDMAIVNPTGTPMDISVGFRTVDGLVSTGNTLSQVPAGGHLSFALSTQFPVIHGHVGLAEFYSATGNFSVIALRTNPTNSFTTAPVYFQSGAPMIQADTSNPYPTGPPCDPYYGCSNMYLRSPAGGAH